jgi:hypothetical protein
MAVFKELKEEKEEFVVCFIVAFTVTFTKVNS